MLRISFPLPNAALSIDFVANSGEILYVASLFEYNAL